MRNLPIREPLQEPGGDEVRRLLAALEEQATRTGLPRELVAKLRQELEESQRKQTVLHQEAKDFRSLVENAADVIARFDRNLRCQYVNPAMEPYTGMRRADFVGKSHREAGFPEALCHLWEIKLGEAFGSGKKVTFEFAFTSATGQDHCHECQLVPELDEASGQVVSVMCVGRDVSEAKAAVRAQRRREQECRKVLEQCPSAIVVYDQERRYRLVNSAGVQLSGLSEEEHLGRRDEELWPREVTDGFLPALKRALAEGQRQSFEWTMPARFGRHTLLITYVPLLDASDKVQQVMGIGHDITAAKDAQEALRASRDRLKFALEAGQAGMTEWDLRSNKLCWTGRHYEILGFPPDSFEPDYESWRKQVHPEDLARVEEEFHRCMREAKDSLVEYRVIWPSGEVRWVRTTGRFDYDSTGQAVTYTGISFDITGLKQAEERVAFLAEGSALLASTLDPQEILTRLTRLAVPHLADFCVIYEVDSATKFHMVARAHRTREMESVLDRIGERYDTIPTNPQSWIVKAIGTGEAQLLAYATLEDCRRATEDPELVALWVLLGCHSCIVVPLAARGQTLGVMFLFMAQSPQVYGPEQVREAQEVGGRAAVALDHARLFGEAQCAQAAAQAAGRAKDHFIAVLSHELRTPLTPVLTTTQLLQRDAALTQEQRESI